MNHLVFRESVERIKSCIFLLFLLWAFPLQAQYNAENIPHPKIYGQQYYVSNPDVVLSEGTVAELNRLLQEIDSVTSAEYAIVVVNDYVGDSDFEFALNLFNQWGIGKEASNNGLLLFIAKDRREYRFISGYGMEHILPDAYLKRIGEKYLVPHFRDGDYDGGILEASRFVHQILQSADSRAELARMMPESVPFWSIRNSSTKNTILVLFVFVGLYVWLEWLSRKLRGRLKKKKRELHPIISGCGCMGLIMFLSLFIFAFVFNNLEQIYQYKNLPYFVGILGSLILSMKFHASRTAISASYKDEGNRGKALNTFTVWGFIPAVLAPLAYYDLGMMWKRSAQNKARLSPPDTSGAWTRLDRDKRGAQPAKYLDKGQQKEEKLSSRTYEIWLNSNTNESRTVGWDGSNRYVICTSCGYKTLETGVKVQLRAATYTSEGKGERKDICRQCSYEESKGTYVIARRVHSSSGGSSRGGSSSGGGSSSSSGSFGGGSSGGGGAGGRW